MTTMVVDPRNSGAVEGAMRRNGWEVVANLHPNPDHRMLRVRAYPTLRDDGYARLVLADLAWLPRKNRSGAFPYTVHVGLFITDKVVADDRGWSSLNFLQYTKNQATEIVRALADHTPDAWLNLSPTWTKKVTSFCNETLMDLPLGPV